MLVRFLWPILLIGAVTIGLVVSASGAETRDQIEYLSRIEDQATELAKSATALQQVISRLQVTSRADFMAAMESIEEDLQDAMTLVEEDPPTPSVIPVRSLYRQAVTAWEEGIGAFITAVLGAADHPDDPNPIDQMANAIAVLRAGDAVYATLLDEMEGEDIPAPLTPLSPVAMIATEVSLVQLSLTYVEAARSELNSLALRPGLGVAQVVADPEWQVDASEQVVIPATDAVAFSVVMTNAGNVVSEPQEVVLTVLGGPEEIGLSQTVDPLQPGRQVTLVFEPVAVIPGGIYEVSASIEVSGEDTNLEDNLIKVLFTVNEA